MSSTTTAPVVADNVTVNETMAPERLTHLYLYDCRIIQMDLYAPTQGLQRYVPEGYVLRPVAGPMGRIVATFADCDGSSTDNVTHEEGGGFAWFAIPIDSTKPDDLNQTYGATVSLQGANLAESVLRKWNYTQGGLEQTISGSTPASWALAARLGNGSFAWSAVGAPSPSPETTFAFGQTSLDVAGGESVWLTLTGTQHGQFLGPCRHDGLEFGSAIADWACDMAQVFSFSAVVTLNLLGPQPLT